MTSKHLLAQGTEGNIEKVCIYNWQRLPRDKIKLLDKPNTRIILKYYNRKMSNEGLPMYRIDNPDLIDIDSSDKTTHTLTLSRIAAAASTLLKANYTSEAKFLFDYLFRLDFSDEAQLLAGLS